ncbi:ABC transporter permease [Pseudobacillus badius]|uniref:ABC transporter permease n=1 Tax=Bacillus badius TaxID=1455 RepID=UPI0007B060B3|nr:ABC transporter permease [Bacillus badius]KZO01723.1 branched-chain amino acid ABC transporter permease [Bacillus badius]MED0667382.1 ABC transporter permease [Bacillus badius]OCS90116.1 branched-chain amino acid ABC transporter permease [Bacillus badius]OVE53644.1 branched-chain amino acid ABC transporter permease [Bacillus badius]TDW06014.1 nucleoside ABC transporter membrane protein [Bacillus badius]
MSKRFSNLAVPVVSVLLGLIAGAIIMLISGYDPISGYAALWNGAFGDSFYVGETLRQMTPYIFAGLAVAFAFRTGLFNIGVEGQLLVGWLAAVWVGVAFDLPKIVHLPLSLLAAAAAGALWGLIPGILKARLHVHEVIVTIMMNYVALHLTNHLIRNVISDQSDSTEAVKETASLKSSFFESLTDFSSLHNGIYLGLIAAVIMWFMLEKTTLGYELRSVGYSQHASQYAGMNVSRNIVLSMVISGAFAGLGGAMEGLGTFGNAFLHSGFSGVGFDGIAVALLGGNAAIGVVLASLLFGALKVGALNMPIESGVPNELVEIVIALIIFFVASSYMIKWLLSRFKKEEK